MKILAVGMNYREHVRELKNTVPESPVIFIKPDSAYATATDENPPANKPFFLPDFSHEIHYETELVVKFCRLGRQIESKFAARYYAEVTVGLDLTARDLQRQLRSEGKPWEISKGFDQSAIVGRFVPLESLGPIQQLHFRLDLNGKTVQTACTSEMIFSVDDVVAYASQFFTIKTGDLLFTGTPSGVGALQIGDHLEAYLEGEKLLDLRIR